MRSRPDRASGSQESQGDEHRGLTYGWRAYGAVNESIVRLDNKASIVLTLGSAVLGYLVILSGSHRVLSGLHGWRAVVEKSGLGILGLAVLLAALAVFPKLSRARLRRGLASGCFYFGELRRRAPEDVSRWLNTLTVQAEVAELADQLVISAKISWYKYSLLQAALVAMAVGVVLVSLSVIWP
jgi:hypothetical protein